MAGAAGHVHRALLRRGGSDADHTGTGGNFVDCCTGFDNFSVQKTESSSIFTPPPRRLVRVDALTTLTCAKGGCHGYYGSE